MIGLYKLNMQACSICEMVEKQDKQRENIVYRRIMMNKKMIVLLTCAAMSASAMTGCASSNAGASGEGNTAAAGDGSGKEYPVIRSGRFVLEGCEELNRAFDEE